MFLKSGDISTIEKKVLVSILERDNLKLEEIDIWDCVIQWGIGQKQELKKHLSNWNKDDFGQLKNILSDDIIPSIRFDQISSDDFYEKIKPYKKIFDKEMYEEILRYHL